MRTRFLPACGSLLLFSAMLILYWITLAPGLTWANGGADGGDLITAAATGGVAHPSGYPVYLLLARLFQYLPIGALAFRTNLLSAVLTALTTVVIYWLVIRSPHSPVRGNVLAGLIAGAAYGLSPLAWSQAVITEIYALHALIVALILFLLLGEQNSKNDLMLGLALSLGMGNHLTTVFLLPPAILISALRSRSDDRQLTRSINWPALGRVFAAFAVGLLAYASLPMRALSHPPVNWGNPITLENFWWLVSGAVYRDRVLALPPEMIVSRLQSAAGMFAEQFGWLGLLIGFYQLFVNATLSRSLWLTVWVALVNLVFSLTYATVDSYVYLLPFFLAFAIWIGFGSGQIMDALRQRKQALGALIGVLLALYFMIMAVSNYSRVDASQDERAETFGRAVISEAPPNALILADGDQAIFALWYFHFALKERPDLIVIAGGLLPYDWYRTSLQQTYPALIVPTGGLSSLSAEALFESNALRPACRVSAEQNLLIICSELEEIK